MHSILESSAFFMSLPGWVSWGSVVLILFLFGYRGAPLWLWSLAGVAALTGFGAPVWLLASFLFLAVLFNLKPLRRAVLSAPLMKLLDALKILPAISETEQTAIDAGTVWVEGELFSGKPNLKRLSSESYPDLTQKEKDFMDGPVEELCSMVSDWEVFQSKDFTGEAWNFMKEKRFFGLIIPEKYGGHGFSANAHSAIVGKLASRCGPLATTVMVPNSLGPAELLMHYGTDKQKDHYLPRLAKGEEIPCFALTEPNAGSDAGAMQRVKGNIWVSRQHLYRATQKELNWDCVTIRWVFRSITVLLVVRM